MKLNLDLVRKILLDLEENETPDGYNGYLSIPGHSPEEVHYHASLMEKKGLITAFFTEGGSDVIAPRLTWSGHDFIALSTSNKLWNNTKKVFAEKGIGVTLELAAGYMKKLANDYLGLE